MLCGGGRRDFSQTERRAFPCVVDARRRTGQVVVASKVSLRCRIEDVMGVVEWAVGRVGRLGMLYAAVMNGRVVDAREERERERNRRRRVVGGVEGAWRWWWWVR